MVAKLLRREKSMAPATETLALGSLSTARTQVLARSCWISQPLLVNEPKVPIGLVLNCSQM